MRNKRSAVPLYRYKGSPTVLHDEPAKSYGNPYKRTHTVRYRTSVANNRTFQLYDAGRADAGGERQDP